MTADPHAAGGKRRLARLAFLLLIVVLTAAAVKDHLDQWLSQTPSPCYSLFRPSASENLLLIQHVKDAEQAAKWAEGAEMQSWGKYGCTFDATAGVDAVDDSTLRYFYTLVYSCHFFTPLIFVVIICLFQMLSPGRAALPYPLPRHH